MGKHEHTEHVAGTFAFADVEIDARAHRLLRDGREIAIEPKAFAVLLEFLTHPGQLLSRDQLLDAVWGHSYITPATLNRIVAQLRKALADDSENPHCIQTVHGLGYRFIAPLERAAPEVSPSLRFAPPVRARVPERTDPLIGRESDIETLKRLLRDHRLVTITGPGGIGKTQAALETARQVAGDFPDGVWLFDCTMQTDEQELARMLTGTLEIRTTTDAEDLVIRLSELLRARQALLVFDNCERIAGPLGRILAPVLAACAVLHVLVTSQRRLNCAGETLCLLPPLELPAEGKWTSEEQVADLAHVPAVQLLLMRLRAFASGFALSPANAGEVAELCRRLAGLPLALELAAARLRLLSPQQLLARLDVRLLNLAEADSGRPAHHQNLRALIEWSFALLSEQEQSLLCGISIFAGACTLDGATAIGAALGLDDQLTLDLLSGLMDKSLLGMDGTTAPPGYRLLDSVRLFALERLASSGNEVRVRTAHLVYFVQLTERIYAEIRSSRFQLWFERIRREWTDLHAAFDFALEHPDLIDDAMALVGNLCWYLRGSTDYHQSAQWAEKVLRASHAPSRHLARALIASGVVLHFSKVRESAGMRLHQGIAMAKEAGDDWLAAAGEAILTFELAISGDFAGAEACAEAVLAVAVQLDDQWLRSNALLGLGVAHSINGRHRDAEASISQGLDCLSSHKNSFEWAYTLINRGLQRFYLGDLGGAARDWLTDLEWFTSFQNWRGTAGCVEGTAYLAVECGEPALAARFLAAAAKVREWTGAPLFPQWCKGQELAVRRAHEVLGGEFKLVQQDGASAHFEDVVAEARALLADIAADQPERTGASSPSGS